MRSDGVGGGGSGGKRRGGGGRGREFSRTGTLIAGKGRLEPVPYLPKTCRMAKHWDSSVESPCLYQGVRGVDRVVGLVVKASASRAEDPDFESRLRRDFWGVESYQ